MKQKIFSLTLGILAGLALFFLVSSFFDVNSTVTKIKNNKSVQSTGILNWLDWKPESIFDLSWNTLNYTWNINYSKSWTMYWSWDKPLEIRKGNRLNTRSQ